jgi:secreted PhoX family phosphatase
MLVALPRDFQYTVFGKSGSPMSDGNLTPRRHDGMAAFSDGNLVRLVRNHEINNGTGKPGVLISTRGTPYDPLAGGGTVTMLVDAQRREVVRDFISLSGTLQNCAGGLTPWGSWLTCEEAILGQGHQFNQEHGYIFEVPAGADTPATPVPLKAMGRFIHEAVAVDPGTGIVYETEDSQGMGAHVPETSGFYRFTPQEKQNLAAGGRLEMLALRGHPGYDTRTRQRVGQQFDIEWVAIDNPDPVGVETDPLAVYKQGLAKGGATFARLEGCWYGDGSIFINATSGGDRKLGQVWEYRPEAGGGTLRLLFESRSTEVLNAPDNLCVSPRGGLVLCEDLSGGEYLRGLTRDGDIFDFAKNIAPGAREFAGATFSPDGQTLFVNVQEPGMTLAIWGPWDKGSL